MADLRLRALQCLSRREHSRAELRAKLVGHADSEVVLDALLDSLQAERLLSDHRYASQRVAARASRYGNGRLRQELRQHGVSENDIEAALPEAGDELVRCQTIWAKKFGRMPTSAEERAKQMRFLQYRGFSAETIRQTLRGADEA